MKTVWEKTEILSIGADKYQEIFEIPHKLNLTPVYFVKLGLKKKDGTLISDNVYWLSTGATPDYSSLSGLEPVPIDMIAIKEVDGKENHITVKLANNTGKLSFFNRLVITKGEGGEEVLPTFWNSNFIILFPGEEKTVTATIETEDLHGTDPYLSIDGNNKVKPVPLKKK
jgi:exo-1,4-beta-D-glucosaminidase